MALALESAAAITSTGRDKLKCKKCREVLLFKPDHEYSDVSDPSLGEESNILSVDEEKRPQWIDDQIEQGGWTKGKLTCYKCGTRVGGFDFVSGMATQVYIVKSKVDFNLVLEANVIKPSIITPPTINPTENISEPITTTDINTIEAMTSESSANESTGLSTASSSTTESCQDASISHASQGADETDVDLDSISTSSQNHTDHESSSTEEDLQATNQQNQLTRNQMEKIKRRKKRRERKKEMKAKEKSQESKVQDKLRELLEAEPELDALPDELICPVCLDILFEPFQTEPCRHIFCEPCLRRLGQKNAMNTKCPLCRSKIRFCKHLAATSREIREQHEAMYLRRKKFERSTPVFSYPLPWTPGWRNLLRGRPLGGNTIFVDENNQAEYMRTVLLQIPYYIPPVFLANIFNILVFGFLLGVVELLPTLFYALMGLRSGGAGAGGGINLTDAIPESTSDETGTPSGDNLAESTDPTAEPGLNIQPTHQDNIQDLPGSIPEEMSVEAEALDSTFYFILFVLSLTAAVAGQLIINHRQGRQRFGHRIADTMVVICFTCAPLLIIPTFLPYRAPQGNYLGMILKRMVGYAIDNISYQTVLLVMIVTFMYHFDVIDEMIA